MKKEKIKVLLIEDDLIDQMAFQKFVKDNNLPYDYSIAGSAAQAKEILNKQKFDIVITDYKLGDGTAFDIFEYIVDTPFIFTTGAGDEEIAVKAMKAGAFYYHIKDQERYYLELLPVSIQKALKNKKMEGDQRKAEEALKESEEKFRAISSAANDAIIMLNYQGEVVFWNRTAKKIFGYNKNEIIGKNLHDLITPSSSNKHYLKSLKSQWETGTSSALGKTVEMTVLKKNKQPFDIELSLSAVKIEKGMNQIAIIRDITERKKAELALQESEERYRTLQGNIPVGIYRSSKKGKFLSANPAMAKILGYKSKEELFNIKIESIYKFPQQRNTFINEIEAKGSVTAYELQLLRKDRTPFWAAVTTKALINFEDSSIYYDGIIEDITVQKEAQEQLRQNKERLDHILQNIGNGVMVIDSNQELILMNNRIVELLGLKKDLIKHTLSDMLVNCKDNGKILFEALNQSSFRNLELTVEIPILRVLYVTATTFTDIYGKSAGKIFILADVTREKEIENMKTSFVSSVSHELRTPITSIIGFSKTMLLNKKINDETRNEFINIIYKESKRLSNLIEDVLSISRIESGQVLYNFKEISIGPIIQDIFNIYKIHAEKKGIKLSCIIEKDIPLIKADNDSIHQIAINFIGNALKFTGKGGQISIQLKQENDFLILNIEDTGLGIPKKDQKKIFDRFFSVNRPGTVIQGTGLGLSIAKEMVHDHKGRIEVYSQEGKGTLFKIFFPVLKKII